MRLIVIVDVFGFRRMWMSQEGGVLIDHLSLLSLVLVFLVLLFLDPRSHINSSIACRLDSRDCPHANEECGNADGYQCNLVMSQSAELIVENQAICDLAGLL